MASRKLKVVKVSVIDAHNGDKKNPYSVVTIQFSRKLTSLEVSGVKAVLDGEIK
jgi:hypothetical protein